MNLDPIEIAVALVALALPLAGVVDAARMPADAWRSAGRSKRFWIGLQILTLYIGAVAYFAGIRRDVHFFTVPPSEDWQDAG